MKPVLKKDIYTELVNETMNRHVRLAIVEDESGEKDDKHRSEFEKHRRVHYDEIKQLRMFREENPEGFSLLDCKMAKPVLKKQKDDEMMLPSPTTSKKRVVVIPADPVITEADPEQKHDSIHRVDFEQHRKQHYNEMQVLRKFREEHPEGLISNIEGNETDEGFACGEKAALKQPNLDHQEQQHKNFHVTLLLAKDDQQQDPLSLQDPLIVQEFQQRRKRHYNEIEELKRFRQQHPNGLVDEIDKPAIKYLGEPSDSPKEQNKNPDVHVQIVAELVQHDPQHLQEFEKHRRDSVLGEIEPVRKFLLEHPEGPLAEPDLAESILKKKGETDLSGGDVVQHVKFQINEQQEHSTHDSDHEEEFYKRRRELLHGEMEPVRQFLREHPEGPFAGEEEREHSLLKKHGFCSHKKYLHHVQLMVDEEIRRDPHQLEEFDRHRRKFVLGEMEPVRQFLKEHPEGPVAEQDFPKPALKKEGITEMPRKTHSSRLAFVEPDEPSTEHDPQFEQLRKQHYHGEMEPVQKLRCAGSSQLEDVDDSNL